MTINVHRSERRREYRRNVDIPASVSLENGSSVVCRLKNLSQSGALIEFYSVTEVPDMFMLNHSVTGAQMHCEVRRRNGHLIGVSIAPCA